MCINYLAKFLEGQSAGEGVKKTQAYETQLSKSQYERFREEFWGIIIQFSNIYSFIFSGTRVEGDIRVWNLLRSCVEADSGYFYFISL